MTFHLGGRSVDLDAILEQIDAEFWPLLGGKAELEFIMGARLFRVHKSIYRPFYDAGTHLYASYYYRRSRAILRNLLPNFLEFKFFIPYDGHKPRPYALLSTVEVRNITGHAMVDVDFSRCSVSGIVKNINVEVLRRLVKDFTGYTIRPWG